MVVTVLHPGAMGVAIANSVQRSGATVRAVVNNRSVETKLRAEKSGFQHCRSLTEALDGSDIVLCVCPPHAAIEVASAVADTNFSGLYADCNAISPDRTRMVESIVIASGAVYVDGGIVGGPPSKRSQTSLYLSGPQAAATSVASLFCNGLIEAKVISERVGDASALKMCYAAYTKGSTALLLAIVSAAEELGVRDALEQQWIDEESGLKETAHKRASFVTKKAWRWIDEMEEIANTFESVGAPPGFHRAAADVYRRIQHLRQEGDALPTADEVIKSLGSNNG